MNKENNHTIELNNVSKSYNQDILAVNNATFTTKKGEIIALLGPNGAGKSTLINIIAGYLTQTAGDILVNGKNTNNHDIEIKKNIGFLPEGAPMYDDMTVNLYLKYMIELKLNLEETVNLTSSKIKETYKFELNRIINEAKIQDVINQKIETLSKGYLRRVGFAVSIIGNPDILLLDEPTDGLDPNQKEHIRDIIKNMGENKTIIISTHLLEEAQIIANKIIFINKGCILFDGTLSKMLSFTKTKNIEEAFKKLTKVGEI